MNIALSPKIAYDREQLRTPAGFSEDAVRDISAALNSTLR